MTPEERQEIIRRLEAGEELSPEWARILFPPEKREYELVYHGKEREEDILADTLAVPLQAVRTFGKNGGNGSSEWHNMLIFGDNLQVMKSLLEMKKASKLCNADGTPGVRLVYIDPPFATKQDFGGSEDEKAYQDKMAGARFLEFLRKRLVMLRELMAADGHIFVHVDYRKGHYIKGLMDEIFGEHNFRNEIILPGRASKNLQQQFKRVTRLNVRHDNLFWYSASAKSKVSTLWVEKHDKGNPEGHWHHFWSTADRPTMRYRLFGIKPETGQWVWEEERATRAVANHDRFLKEGGGRTLAEYWRDTGGKLEFVRRSPEDGKPQYWRAPAEDRVADTIWTGIPVYSNSTKYPTEKNEKLLDQIIDFITEEGDVVMDAFAGSGTTLAVAEKLKRRWIGIDCGKLSIYTMQKRLLNLRREIGNTGPKLECKPFRLYNAGLYDFSTLKTLPWTDWRFFALQLFGCKDEPHTIGGLKLDGKLKGASVLVFNHHENPGKRIDEETIQDIHAALRNKIGRKFFVIAPRGVFDFQQDYIDLEGIRYYALRIPYSIINELHHRDFTALRQPNHETAVNETVDAVGFDFIRPPKVDWSVAVKKRKGQLLEEASLKVKSFQSYARLRGEDTHGGLESFSMLMLDFDYDGEVFDLDTVFYAHQLEETSWEAWFPVEPLGSRVMAVFIDIHGNEAREVIAREKFGLRAGKAARKTPKAVKA
ncbi:DNA methyltransferase [Candidatus Nitrospira bockiana]